MNKRSQIFWISIAISIAGGLIALAMQERAMFVIYSVIIPFLFIWVSSWRIFDPVRYEASQWASWIIFFNVPGSLLLHNLGIQYDIFLHGAMGFVSFYILWLIWPHVFRNKRFSLWWPILAIAFGGLAFEGVQLLSDMFFGTHSFFDITQTIEVDFVMDMVMDMVGAVVGIIYVKFRK